jgi:hypothetical protein
MDLERAVRGFFDLAAGRLDGTPAGFSVDAGGRERVGCSRATPNLRCSCSSTASGRS